MPPNSRTIRVRCSSTPVGAAAAGYDVVVGRGLLQHLAATLRTLLPKATRAALVADTGLPDHTIARTHSDLSAAGFTTALIPITPSEPGKSLDTLAVILDQLAALKLERREPVIALGGGIVGDTAGFAAAAYRRGAPVIQFPTTLLAMVDASVGGKTGVNLTHRSANGATLLKNMVGAFHQPLAVFADVDLLATLPERHFRSGLAECVKHALIGAPVGEHHLFSWLKTAAPRILARDPDTLCELVARNVAIKAAIVGLDEREELDSGGRALLNLGHTFGHALEVLPDLAPDAHTPGPLHHGEAVALGLVAAARCAQHLNLFAAPAVDELIALLDTFGLPTRVRNLPPGSRIIELMMHDKKVAAGTLRLILPDGPGTARVVAVNDLTAIERAIDDLRAR